MNLKIRDRRYEVTDLHISSTYADIMVGSKELSLNTKIHIQYHYPKAWGDRKSFKVQPSIEQLLNGLPKYCIHAWVISEPIAAWADASELVISWYMDCLKEPIDLIVHRTLEQIDWVQESKDFEY